MDNDTEMLSTFWKILLNALIINGNLQAILHGILSLSNSVCKQTKNNAY